jgi:hypothetical protein
MSLGGSDKGAQDVNIPAFTSSGGITPEQGALAQYTYGEGMDAIGNEFGQSGTGQSTMATQAGGGINFADAEQQGQMSDVDQGAQYQLFQNDVGNELQGLANQANQNTQNAAVAGTEAKAAGQLIGGLGAGA